MGDGAPRRTSWRVLPGEGALQDVLEQLSLAEKRVRGEAARATVKGALELGREMFRGVISKVAP